MGSGYSKSKENIGNLPLGEVDAIISSPPYSEALSVRSGGGNGDRLRGKPWQKQDAGNPIPYSLNEKNIGNLPHGKIDTVITSPPYSEALSVKAGGGSLKNVEGDGVVSDGKPQAQGAPKPYSTDEAQIGNLRHGDIDAVITSPPYSQQNIRDISKEPYGSKLTGGAKRNIKQVKPYSENPENIGNLSHGDVDAIITSPPYSDGFKHNPQDKEKRLQKLVEVDKRCVEKGQKWARTSKEALERRLTQQDDGYGVSKENIGNLPLGEVEGIDAVITSPPYCGSAKGSDREELWERMSDDPTSNRFGRKSHPHTAEGYSKSKENIGNLPHGDVDAIITSPPYEASVSDDKEGPSAGADEKKYGRWRKGTAKKQSYTQNGEPCKVDAIITSPPYGETTAKGLSEKQIKICEQTQGRRYTKKSWMSAKQYSEDPSNIGNLSHGEIDAVDAIITSPPYEGSLEGTTRHTRGGIASRDPKLAQSGTFATVMSFGVPVGYTPNKDNIGNLKSSEEEYKGLVDSIITSPPYEGGTFDHAGGHGGAYAGGIAERDETMKPLTVGKNNIGNLKSSEDEYKALDAIITSPPYKTATEGGGLNKHPPKTFRSVLKKHSFKLSDNPNNIDNLPLCSNMPFVDSLKPSKPTYLSEMFRVYSECYKVLKSGGRIILIVKPFVRSKKAVDLPYHTWLLLERVGFKLVDVLKFRLPAQSFWRVLQYQKYPEIERINHEYIIIAQKP